MGLTKDEKRALSLRAAIAILSRHGSSHPQKRTDPDLAVNEATTKMNKGHTASSRKERKEPEGDCNERNTQVLMNKNFGIRGVTLPPSDSPFLIKT